PANAVRSAAAMRSRTSPTGPVSEANVLMGKASTAVISSSIRSKRFNRIGPRTRLPVGDRQEQFPDSGPGGGYGQVTKNRSCGGSAGTRRGVRHLAELRVEPP